MLCYVISVRGTKLRDSQSCEIGGSETKNDCAGEDQQQFPDPTDLCQRRNKNLVIGPAGPDTKNDCTDEGQEQITRPDQICDFIFMMLKTEVGL
jgi:hypothetical protein